MSAEGFVITKEWIGKNHTKGSTGGYNAKQLRSIGVEWPPVKGWKARAVGARITEAQKCQFERYAKLRKAKKNTLQSQLTAEYKAENRAKVVDIKGFELKASDMALFSAKRKKVKPNNNGSFYTSREWRALRYKALKRDGRECACCGARPGNGIVLHVDHIKPRSKYPELELSLDNLQVLCEDCNLGKSNTDSIDYRKKAN